MIVKKSCDYVHDFVKAGAGKEGEGERTEFGFGKYLIFFFFRF